MARLAAVVCLLALAAASGTDARGLRQAGRARTQCKTEAKATLSLSGSGSGRAKAQSLCKAVAEAEGLIESRVTDWCEAVFSSQDGCVAAELEDMVDGVATAQAKVATSVKTQVKVEGTGTACASGAAEGNAAAASLLNITLEVTLGAVAEKYGEAIGAAVEEDLAAALNSASASATGTALSVVIAQAWSSAFDAICTAGGFDSGEEASLAEQLSAAYTQLYGRVAVRLCEERGFDASALTPFSSSESDANADISGVVEQATDEVTEGQARTGGSQPGNCMGDLLPCCNATSLTCSCGNGCFAAKSFAFSDLKVWQYTTIGEDGKEKFDNCVCQ